MKQKNKVSRLNRRVIGYEETMKDQKLGDRRRMFKKPGSLKK